MIVNNTCPNVRIFSYKGKDDKIASTFFMFPGINGEVPDAVAESEHFKEQEEAGLMIRIATKKPLPVDPTRANVKQDRLAVIPDNDVVAMILDTEEKKALSLIPDIVKRATLVSLQAQEKRSNVIQAIVKQITDIDNLNMPARK
jgi:hypothetical protein